MREYADAETIRANEAESQLAAEREKLRQIEDIAAYPIYNMGLGINQPLRTQSDAILRIIRGES